MNGGAALLLGAAALAAVAVAAGGGAAAARTLAPRRGGFSRVSQPDGPVGRHYRWSDFTRSTTAAKYGIPNVLTPAARANLTRLVELVLDPLQDNLDARVRVTSGYRSPALNAVIPGAASDSDHMEGHGADIQADGIGAKTLATAVVALGLPFDQLIWYAPERGGHVHVSTDPKMRGMTLYAPAGGGYVPWTPGS